MKNLQLTSKIHNISELKAILSDENSTNETLIDLYNKFNIKRIRRFFDNVKSKGIEVSNIMFSLFLTRIIKVTVRALILSGQNPTEEIKKDVFYRFKNNSKIDWRKLLYYFIYRYIILVKRHTKETTESIKCLIIDDTFLAKTGKMIEFIGKVFDHVTKKSLLGFKMLTLGYWDGMSMNPIDFSLHREFGKNPKKPYGMKKKDLSKQYSKKRTKKDNSYQRVKELDVKKTSNAISMIKRALKHGIKANYVLMDSWFVSEEMIVEIRKIKQGCMHLLGMCKMDKRKYEYNYKKLTAKELLRKYKDCKQNKRCRQLRSRYIRLVVDYKGIPMVLFFSKYRNQKDWNLLVTTNLELTYIKAIEIYQIRWSIEVFFKEGKQYLQLGKTQSNDFDAQIADITISIMVYMLLNLRKRFSAYETIGEIFKQESKQLKELTLWEKIWGLFQEILIMIVELFEIDIEKMLEKIINENSEQEKLIFILEKLNEKTNVQNAA
jgi:hypothetical protein